MRSTQINNKISIENIFLFNKTQKLSTKFAIMSKLLIVYELAEYGNTWRYDE